MKKIIFCSTIMLVTSLLCLGQSKYKFYYRPVIKSEGYYDLAGKKYYVAEVRYDSLGTDISESRIETFGNYVRQSLALKGAVEVKDKQDADFMVNASVLFWGSESESSLYSPTKQRVGGKGARADAWKLTREAPVDSYGWSPTPVNLSRSQENAYRNPGAPPRPETRDVGFSKRTYHHNYFHKMIEIAALDNDDKPLFKATVSCHYRDLGFRALNPNEVLLFVAADSYGNNSTYGFNLDAYNEYLALFKKGELAGNSNITYAPNSTPSSNRIGIFLVDRQPDKTVVVVKDEGKLKLDQSKRKTAMLKVGDNLLPCSNMSYSANKIAQGVRLLTLEFPSIGDTNEFDLIFCKKNKPEKVKASVNNIEAGRNNDLLTVF